MIIDLGSDRSIGRIDRWRQTDRQQMVTDSRAKIVAVLALNKELSDLQNFCG